MDIWIICYYKYNLHLHPHSMTVLHRHTIEIIYAAISENIYKNINGYSYFSIFIIFVRPLHVTCVNVHVSRSKTLSVVVSEWKYSLLSLYYNLYLSFFVLLMVDLLEFPYSLIQSMPHLSINEDCMLTSNFVFCFCNDGLLPHWNIPSSSFIYKL